MVDWSLILAVLVVALLGGALTGAVSLAIGGLGVTRGLKTRLDSLQADTERTDERITREVKTRAGIAGVTKRTDATVKAEAEAALAAAPHGGGRPRPSVVRQGDD